MASLVLDTNKRKSTTPYEVYKKYNWEELHPDGSPRTPLTCAKLASTFRNPKPCDMTIENMCHTLSTAYLQEVKTTGDFQCHNCYNYKELHKVYKGLSDNVVKEAFGWDDNFMIPKPDVYPQATRSASGLVADPR